MENRLDFDKLAGLARDDREAFRAGYLARAALEGLAPSDLAGSLAKRAAPSGEGAFGSVMRTLGISSMLQRFWQGGAGKGDVPRLGLALGVPAVVGGVTGWGLANMTNPDKQDIQIMEDEGLANEYRRQTNALRGDMARSGRPRDRKQRSIGL